MQLNINGMRTNKTCLGAMASIFSVLLVVFYLNIRLDILMNYKDTVYHSDAKVYSENKIDLRTTNFNFAFGLVQAEETDHYPEFVNHTGFIEYELHIE